MREGERERESDTWGKSERRRDERVRENERGREIGNERAREGDRVKVRDRE